MASGSVSVRLPEEVLEQLNKVAHGRKQKVSDVVREFILNGLKSQPGAGSEQVTQYLEGIADLLTALLHETVGARYYASIATSYAVDMESLLREKRVMDADAKDALISQFEEAAMQMAHETWLKVQALKQQFKPDQEAK